MTMPRESFQWPWQQPDQQPAPTGKPYQAPALPPAQGATPDQQAQYIVDSYLAWMAAGGPTVPDPSGAKDSSGQPLTVPTGPDGQPSNNIPTRLEFDSARQYLASKASTTGTTNVSAPPTERYVVRSDGSYYENPNWTPPVVKPGQTQAEIDQAANDAHQRAVADLAKAGETTPHQTQAEIDQAANDAHQRANADLASSAASASDANQRAQLTALQIQLAQEEEPLKKQQLQAQIDQLNADIASKNKPTVVGGGGTTDRYITLVDAQGNVTYQPNQNFVDPDKVQQAINSHQAALQRIDQLVQDGSLTPDQAVQARQDLDQMLHAAFMGTTPEQMSVDQANQQNQQQQRQYEQNSLALSQANDQAGVLKQQASQGQGVLDTLVKAGVAPSLGTIHFAYDPLYQAQALIHNAVAQGQAPPTAIPTPKAPVPAAGATPAMQAPVPAYTPAQSQAVTAAGQGAGAAIQNQTASAPDWIT